MECQRNMDFSEKINFPEKELDVIFNNIPYKIPFSVLTDLLAKEYWAAYYDLPEKLCSTEINKFFDGNNIIRSESREIPDVMKKIVFFHISSNTLNSYIYYPAIDNYLHNNDPLDCDKIQTR